MQFRPRNLPWLASLGVMIGIGIFGADTPTLQAALMSVFGVIAAVTLVNWKPSPALRRRVKSPKALSKTSAAAREAVERSARRNEYQPDGIAILDLGLITTQASSAGMVMRRGRTISLDEDGVRPYITLQIDPEQADRHAVIRFEIIDQDGVTQYIHEMKSYLRDGEMNILADHHLPLADNDKLTGSGEWDLRVSMDGMPIAILAFATTPSLRERSRRIAEIVEKEDPPARLEDLLRQKSRGGR